LWSAISKTAICFTVKYTVPMRKSHSLPLLMLLYGLANRRLYSELRWNMWFVFSALNMNALKSGQSSGRDLTAILICSSVGLLCEPFFSGWRSLAATNQRIWICTQWRRSHYYSLICSSPLQQLLCQQMLCQEHLHGSVTFECSSQLSAIASDCFARMLRLHSIQYPDRCLH
jgi:hypothetical protein